MQKLWVGILALIGLTTVTPADVREWEAEAAAAMAYAACLRVELPPAPEPIPKPQPAPGKPTSSNQATAKPTVTPVVCSECKGTGKVVYGADDPVVKLGFPAGTYVCPMCGGSGKLDKVKSATKPAVKQATTTTTQSCPSGVCPAPTTYYRRGFLRR